MLRLEGRNQLAGGDLQSSKQGGGTLTARPAAILVSVGPAPTSSQGAGDSSTTMLREGINIMADLTGTTVAFLLTDGYEDSELTSPWQATVDAGATPVLVSRRGQRDR